MDARCAPYLVMDWFTYYIAAGNRFVATAFVSPTAFVASARL